MVNKWGHFLVDSWPKWIYYVNTITTRGAPEVVFDRNTLVTKYAEHRSAISGRYWDTPYSNPSSLGEQPGVQIESMGSMASMPFNGVNGFNEAQRPSWGSKASKVRLADLEVDREILRPSICRKRHRGETPRKCCNCATMTIKGNNINRIHRSIYWGVAEMQHLPFWSHCIQYTGGASRHNI